MHYYKRNLGGTLRCAAHLTQPPHFRTIGIGQVTPKDAAQKIAAQAITTSQFERAGRSGNRNAPKAGI